MATESIRISAVIPASPEELYSAWLDGEKHSEVTGGAATVEPRVGGRHTAWDGYIEGHILELEPASRIVQTWRSLDFPQGAADSKLEILFASAPGGAEVTLMHTDIPEGQGADYEEGWVEHYFKTLQKYFARPVPNGTAPAYARARDVKAPGKKRAAPAKKKKAAPAKKKAAPGKKKAAPAKKKAAPAKKKKAAPAKKKAAPKKSKQKR